MMPHVSEITQPPPFGTWLISFSIMSSRSVHVVEPVTIPSFLRIKRHSVASVHMPHAFLHIHASTDARGVQRLDCRGRRCRGTGCEVAASCPHPGVPRRAVALSGSGIRVALALLNAFGTVPRSAFFGKSSGRVDVNSFGVCWNSPVAMSASSTCEAHGGLRWQRPPGASRSLHPHRAVTAERRPAMLVVSAAAVWAWATVERPRSWGGVRVRTEGPWFRGAVSAAVPAARALAGQLWTEGLGRDVCRAAETLGSGSGRPWSWGSSLGRLPLRRVHSGRGFGLPQWRKLPGSSGEQATVVHTHGPYGSSVLKAAGVCDRRGTCRGPQQNRRLRARG